MALGRDMSITPTQIIVGLIRHPVLRQISGMILLTAVGQGLYLIVGPMLGRLYTPRQLGYYGLFFTIWTVANTFACLIYDQAVPVAVDDDEARYVTIACVVLCGIFGIMFGAVFSVCAAQGWFGLAPLSIWGGPLLTVALVISVANQLAQGWRIRTNDVLMIGRSNVTLNGVRGACQVGLGLINPTWSLLIVGEILGRIASTLQLSANSWCKNFEANHIMADRSIMETLRRHSSLPLAFGPALVLDAAAMLIQITALGMLFGPSSMGQYFLMKRTLDMPVSFAVKSIGDAFYARQILEARNKPEMVRVNFVRSAAGLALIGLVGGLPVILFGPQLFKLFYGPSWALSGLLAAVTMPAIILNFAVAPVARVFSLSKRAHLRIVPGIVLNICNVFVLIIAFKFKTTLLFTVSLVSGVTIIYYMSYFFAGYIAAGAIPQQVSEKINADESI